MNRQSLQLWLVPVLATLICFVLTWSVWRWLWGEWMGNEYYSHGLLIPVVSIFFAVQRVRNDSAFIWIPGQNSLYSFLLLAGSILLFLYLLNDKAYYLAAVGMIGIIAGLIWTLGGPIALRKLLFPIGFLLFMIPMPFVERSTLPLAQFTGVCSGGLVRLLGMNIEIVGNAVTLPNANLVIGAQCSGVNSLIALTAITTLAAYLFDGPLWGRVLMVLLAIPLAMLGNIARVASLLAVASSYGAEAAFIFYHDYSGPVFFVAVMVLIFPLSRLLHCRTLRLEVI